MTSCDDDDVYDDDVYDDDVYDDYDVCVSIMMCEKCASDQTMQIAYGVYQ